jgi:hypothetical protein
MARNAQVRSAFAPLADNISLLFAPAVSETHSKKIPPKKSHQIRPTERRVYTSNSHQLPKSSVFGIDLPDRDTPRQEIRAVLDSCLHEDLVTWAINIQEFERHSKDLFGCCSPDWTRR